MPTRSRFPRLFPPLSAVACAALAAGLLCAPAAAQDDAERVRRLEAEVRALQRAVFPGGDGRFFEPEISTAPPVTPVQSAGPPADGLADGALTDVLERLTAIESQLARLTAATEVNANALEQLETRIDEMETAQVRLPPLVGAIPAPGSGGAAAGGGAELAPVRPDTPAPAAAAGGPTPERVAAVQAVLKPATEDAGDDEYTYGFRLWEAGYYPEAQQQLALFLERYPNHSRASFGRNLLGRAFLDAGNARTAANFFLENYQADKQAARAPDSLLYLAESMIALGDTSRACIALAEFGDTYPALATGRLQQQYDANRGRVDCG